MKQFIAVLRDSLREASDKRSLLVLTILASLVILLCASISFEGRSSEDVLKDQAKSLNRFSMHRMNVHRQTSPSAAYDVGDPHAAASGGYVVQVDFKDVRELDRLVRGWEEFQLEAKDPGRRSERRQLAAETQASEAPPASSSEARQKFLEQRFADFGYSDVKAVPLAGAEPRYEIVVVPRFPRELRGAAKLYLLFGLLPAIPLTDLSAAELVVMIENRLADTFCGSIGLLIALLVCSSFVPNMLQKGTLDLVLARPIGRAKLLLAKYLGGCWFVFLMASVLISGAWLAFALRLGYWSPWFLLTVLVVTAQFAVPYSVAVLVGVWSRSSGVSALAAIAIWMISGAIVEWRTVVKTGVFQQADWLNNSLEVIYTILPKTADVSALNQRLLARAYLSPEALQRVGLTKLPHVDPWFSFGTTAAFVAVVLGLACWMFRRRDF